jgi:hypothetical protein
MSSSRISSIPIVGHADETREPAREVEAQRATDVKK